jgi:hypothetical protein
VTAERKAELEARVSRVDEQPLVNEGYRTLHVERYGEPDRDAGGLGGNARCECKGEFSREWSNECESVRDGVCRLESASSVFLEV